MPGISLLLLMWEIVGVEVTGVLFHPHLISESELVFNYRLNRARRVTEITFIFVQDCFGYFIGQ